MSWKQFGPLQSWLQVLLGRETKGTAGTRPPGHPPNALGIIRFSTLVGGDWHLPKPGWELGTLISNSSCGSFLDSGSFLASTHWPVFYYVPRGALCRNPVLCLCVVTSSPVRGPEESVCLGVPRCLYPSSQLRESPSFAWVSSPLPQPANSLLAVRWSHCMAHLLCSTSQESSSLFIWCLISWKLLFHILSI